MGESHYVEPWLDGVEGVARAFHVRPSLARAWQEHGAPIPASGWASTDEIWRWLLEHRGELLAIAKEAGRR